MNGALKPLFGVDRHAAPAGAEVGMVVDPEEKIRHAVLFGDDSKKSSQG